MTAILRSLIFLLLAVNLASAQTIGGGGSASGIITSNQGTPNTAANAWPFFATIGGSAISATNGLYTNLLQANAVLSATNGLYSNLLQGNAVLSIANPLFAATWIQPLTNAQGGNLAPVVSAALEASHVFKASAGNLYSAYASSTTGAAGWFVCINATSISAGAITPLEFVAIQAGPSTVGLSYLPGPPGNYSTGITCAVTTANTPYTYTSGGSVFAYHGLVN